MIPRFEIHVDQTGTVTTAPACPFYQESEYVGVLDETGQPIGWLCRNKPWWAALKGWVIPFSVPVAIGVGAHALGASMVLSVLAGVSLGIPGAIVVALLLNPSY